MLASRAIQVSSVGEMRPHWQVPFKPGGPGVGSPEFFARSSEPADKALIVTDPSYQTANACEDRDSGLSPKQALRFVERENKNTD
jgi:hypothetical protein